MHKLLGIIIVIGLALGLAACSGSESSLEGGKAELRVHLTDAPSDYIGAAEVAISEVFVTVAGDGGRYVLLDGSVDPRVFDLMALRGGIEAFLAENPVPEDEVFDQLRLVVTSATVTLAEGYTFEDGTTTQDLKVPSGAQSGIKVDLDEPMVSETGERLLVVVDFDVDESFVIQGNPESPAGIKGVLFTPVLKEKRRDAQDIS